MIILYKEYIKRGRFGCYYGEKSNGMKVES